MLEAILRFCGDKQFSSRDEMLLCCESSYNSKQVSTGCITFHMNLNTHHFTPAPSILCGSSASTS